MLENQDQDLGERDQKGVACYSQHMLLCMLKTSGCLYRRVRCENHIAALVEINKQTFFDIKMRATFLDALVCD